MYRIERILVPVDFSECSWAALKHASSWASRLGAELKFLHVWRVPWYLDDHALTNVGGKVQTLSALARDRAAAEMDRLIWELEKDSTLVTCSTITSGTPRDVILEIANLHDYDLIVMGTHGRTGLSHLFLGSTAEGVVRRAPCPVLTVQHQLQQSETSAEGELSNANGGIWPKRILVPLDFCDCSTAALQHAVELSRVFDASIEVLHVAEIPHCGTPLMPSNQVGELGLSLSHFAVSEATKRLAEIVEPLQERNHNIESRVVAGYPREVIVETIDTNRYDMVILGTHGRKGLSHFLLGSVAEQVVRRAPCPVLTIRSAPDELSKL